MREQEVHLHDRNKLKLMPRRAAKVNERKTKKNCLRSDKVIFISWRWNCATGNAKNAQVKIANGNWGDMIWRKNKRTHMTMMMITKQKIFNRLAALRVCRIGADKQKMPKRRHIDAISTDHRRKWTLRCRARAHTRQLTNRSLSFTPRGRRFGFLLIRDDG